MVCLMCLVPCYSKFGLWMPATLSSYGDLPQIQKLGPHPRPTEDESVFFKVFRGYVCTLKKSLGLANPVFPP